MNVKHTPGPWRIGDSGWTIFGAPNGKPAPTVIATMEQGQSMSRTEMRDNATLIARAPDLLEENARLREVLEYCLTVFNGAIANSNDYNGNDWAHQMAIARHHTEKALLKPEEKR